MHHHGEASLAPYDGGWAEDEACGGESKDYYYANRRPAFQWYHDHALDITSGTRVGGCMCIKGRVSWCAVCNLAWYPDHTLDGTCGVGRWGREREVERCIPA